MSAISTAVRLEQLRADADACGGRELFDRLIAEGKMPEAAAMYACQQAPGTMNTDRAFCQGQHRKMEKMGSLVRGMLQQRAKTAGIDTRGKYYVGGPFGAHDQRSWVTSSEDLITIAKQNNLNLEGVINRKADRTEPVEKEKLGVAPDIVNKLMKKRLDSDPALRERCRNSKHARHELREAIVDKHAAKKRFKKSNRLLK